MTDDFMTSRGRTLLVATCLLLPGFLCAAPSSAEAPQSQPGSVREIKWKELIPKDWNASEYLPNSRMRMLGDADPDAQLAIIEMREAWDKAPTVEGLDNLAVKLAGYLVPLEETRDGIKEFLLVPYFGACIHTPPPPANQIVDVVLQAPTKAFHAMDTVWVTGKFSTGRQASYMGVSGYKIQSAAIDRYVAPDR